MVDPQRWRAPVVVGALVCTHAIASHERIGCRSPAIPAPAADRLRVVSWNLRNFPGKHDLTRLEQQFEALRPHVIALQEIRHPAAITSRWPHLRWHATIRGGRHGPQRLMLGWDPTEIRVTDIREHPSLTMDERVRPALSAYIQPRRPGPDFHLVIVHLKATRGGQPMRRLQWPRLRAVVESRLRSSLDDDVMVVGDFNVAGGPDQSADDEHHELAEALAPTGLRLWPRPLDCTAYWDGARRDTWWEPSSLDLVFGGKFAEVLPSERRADSGLHCATHQCRPFRASDHYPDPDFHGISDHCPIVIDLPRRDDDP